MHGKPLPVTVFKRYLMKFSRPNNKNDPTFITEYSLLYRALLCATMYSIKSHELHIQWGTEVDGFLVR